MKNSPKKLIRLIGFSLAFLAILLLANVYLIKTDAVTCMTVKELTARSDIELALVGSSVVRDHLNPALISEITGKRTFNAAFPSASLQADIAITQTLLKTNRPDWIALVLEPYNFATAKEHTETEYFLMPHLNDPRIMLEYYLRCCREDGLYLDRLFLFREFMATSLSDLSKTWGLRHNTEAAFSRIAQELPEGITYMGEGYLRYDTDETVKDSVRQQMKRTEDPGYGFDLLPSSRSMLLDYKALCEEAGVNLMVVIYPNHTAHLLAEPNCLGYSKSLRDFCSQNDITCFDFTLLKRDFLPCLDEYYFDLYHMNGQGSDLLSDAFARFFNLYTAGEEVSDLFYASGEAYLASVDFITNVWLDPSSDGHTLHADCNRGTLVEPEYRFVLRYSDGSEQLLRDYSPHDGISTEGISPSCGIRVYARPKGQDTAAPVYYDYPADYNARHAS